MRYPGNHKIRCLVLAPFLAMRDAPTWGKAWAWIMGMVQFLTADVFTGIISLVAVAGGVDYLYGRKIARLTQTFEPLKADFGLHNKIVGIILLLIVRSFEHWLTKIDLMDLGWELNTHGMMAVGLAVLLLAKELDSIDHHRQTLGGAPWPVFDQFLALLRRFPGGKLQPPPPPDSEGTR
jgi:hypothetical protein